MKKLTPYSLYASFFMLAGALLQFVYATWTLQFNTASAALLAFALAVACFAGEAKRLAPYRRRLRYVFGWALHSSSVMVVANIFSIACVLLVFYMTGMTALAVVLSIGAWAVLLVFAPKLFLFIDMVANAVLDGIPTRIVWIDDRLPRVVNVESPAFKAVLNKALAGHLYEGRSMAYTFESVPVTINGVHWLDALDKWGHGATQVVGGAIDEILHYPAPKSVRIAHSGPAGTPILVVNLDPKDPSTK